MKHFSPGWYSVPAALAELISLPSTLFHPPPGYAFVYVSAADRSRFYAVARRCRDVRRLTEGEARGLVQLKPSSPSFVDDRSPLSRWLSAHLPHPGLTSDRGAAIRPSSPPLKIAWVTRADSTVYLRLHGRDRSDLSARYCSPFRRVDDSELVSFRTAIGALPRPDEPARPSDWLPLLEAI